MMDIGKLQRCSMDTAFWRAKKHRDGQGYKPVEKEKTKGAE